MDFADAKSIAVLPFANLSKDQENESFADGMHDDVITALAKIHDLKVISRTSVMAYKAGTRNLRQIAAELGVGSVLEGSIQRSGGRVRMNVQLIDARTDAHLWAENYTEEISDIFAVQSRLADAITHALRARFSPEEKSLIARRVTANPEAYELYQRARRLEELLGVGGTREANDAIIDAYERAVAKDPSFALAFAKLSAAHGTLYWFGTLDPSPERRDRAQIALAAAERLAPNAPETKVARGVFEYRCNNAWAQSLVHYRAAERDLPNDSELQGYIASAYRRLGRWHEALAGYERQAVLNPRELGGVQSFAETLFALRRYAEVERWASQHLPFFADTESQVLGLDRFRARARYALDGDAGKFAAAERAGGPHREKGHVGFDYEVALAVGDLLTAEAALHAPDAMLVRGANGIIDDPVSLHRARIARMRGDHETARKLAADALQYFSSRAWNRRQEACVMLGKAHAHALAGRADDATRLAEAGIRLQAERDAYALVVLSLQAAGVYVVLGQQDQAFDYLRRALGGPSPFSAAELRRDPSWAPIRGDPRFEEILGAMKPL